ncbi:transposase [Patescibacteria group bacterium]|nr:transposase [Patescibacteria group bacterium]
MSLPKYNDLAYSHFVTTKTFNNQKIFKEDDCCQILFDNIKFYQRKFKLDLIAWVIMPNHLHMIIWWNADKNPKLTISKIMHGIKWHSAKEISKYLLNRQGAMALPTQLEGLNKNISTQPGRSGATARPKRLKIWQPGFYDFNIYSDHKLEEKINYIHHNPVKANLTKLPENYKWSSYKLFKQNEKFYTKNCA